MMLLVLLLFKQFNFILTFQYSGKESRQCSALAAGDENDDSSSASEDEG